MQANKKIMFFLISLSMFLPQGCSIPGGPVEVILPANSPERRSRRSVVNEDQQSSSIAKRFQGPTQQDAIAIESAVELAEKYAKLSGEMAVLQKKNRDLVAENHQFENQLAATESQLQQTKKELAEANGLLKEMLVELNNWKADILGFRDEMRDADKAQLQALFQICSILGGEAKTEPIKNEDTSSTSTSPNRIRSSETQETADSGG